MARLLIADLLPDVDRVVLLPLPSVATGDVAALAELDLEDRLLAAPDRPGAAVSGFGVIHSAAARLSFRAQAAAALRRTAHARHAFDFDAFTTDVMVLDLARMREQGFSREALPLVEEFGLSDVEALHYLVGPDRVTVPPEWAVVPTRTPAARPRPHPLGRPRQAVAAGGDAGARALAPPRGAVQEGRRSHPVAW